MDDTAFCTLDILHQTYVLMLKLMYYVKMHCLALHTFFSFLQVT